MKMPFQPGRRHRSRVHGFRARMSTAGGRKYYLREEPKEEKYCQRKSAENNSRGDFWICCLPHKADVQRIQKSLLYIFEIFDKAV